MLGNLQIVPRPPVQENIRVISRSSAGATESGDSPGTRPPGPRLNPSDPRLIFEATAWIALTILIAHLSVSLYWDFRAAFQEYVDGIHSKARACQISFNLNACLKPLPALIAQCEEWRYCASRSSLTIKGRAEISANLVGRILNAFIEPLSWKSTVTVILVLGILYIHLSRRI